jgi:hypothetical protein
MKPQLTRVPVPEVRVIKNTNSSTLVSYLESSFVFCQSVLPNYVVIQKHLSGTPLPVHQYIISVALSPSNARHVIPPSKIKHISYPLNSLQDASPMLQAIPTS